MIKKLIILLLIFTSCASRKVNIEKIETKKDSVVETKIKVTTIEDRQKTDSTNIITNADCSEIIITPIDSSKTIIVDGKTYKNVILKIKKSKTNSLYINNKKESNIKRIDSAVAIKTNVKKQTNSKTKIIDKKVNNWYLFYLILLILILYLLWRNRLQLLKLF